MNHVITILLMHWAPNLSCKCHPIYQQRTVSLSIIQSSSLCSCHMIFYYFQNEALAMNVYMMSFPQLILALSLLTVLLQKTSAIFTGMSMFAR